MGGLERIAHCPQDGLTLADTISSSATVHEGDSVSSQPGYVFEPPSRLKLERIDIQFDPPPPPRPVEEADSDVVREPSDLIVASMGTSPEECSTLGRFRKKAEKPRK